MNEQSDYLTITEACAATGLSRKTIWRRIQLKRLQSFKLGTDMRYTYVLRSEVDRLISEPVGQ